MYKVHIFCPDTPELISKIIDAASHAGAGVMGNYTHTAFISKGIGQWMPHEGAKPAIGKIGSLSKVPEVEIEMLCEESLASSVKSAIRSVHPYEEPAIEFVELKEV